MGSESKARWKLPLGIGLGAVLVAVLFTVIGGGERPPAEGQERPVAAAVPSPAPAASPPLGPVAPSAARESPEESLDKLLRVPPAPSSEEPRAEIGRAHV